MLPQLDLLDHKDKDGQSVSSGEEEKLSKSSHSDKQSSDSEYMSGNNSDSKSKRVNKKKTRD